MRLLAFCFLLAFPLAAHAFPEMIRKGYANCMTCHYSPNGGGILTQYGREISREVLSFDSFEGESDFAYGLVKLPEKLALGGDFRAVQTLRDTATYREGKWIFMQSDLEGAYSYDRFDAVATVGLDYQGSFLSRRHYVTYHATDEVAVRAGKFLRQYGINTPDHIISIKRGLGFDEGTETYNLEGSWVDEANNFFVTADFGRPDSSTLHLEQGVTATASRFFGDRYKVGASYAYLSGVSSNRNLFGPFGILAFQDNLFLLSEFDFQLSSGRSGLVAFNRLDYEFVRGFHGFLQEELTRTDFANSQTAVETYGLGVQVFPRPHFEFQGVYQKTRVAAAGSEFQDFAYLLIHFYP